MNVQVKVALASWSAPKWCVCVHHMTVVARMLAGSSATSSPQQEQARRGQGATIHADKKNKFIQVSMTQLQQLPGREVPETVIFYTAART